MYNSAATWGSWHSVEDQVTCALESPLTGASEDTRERMSDSLNQYLFTSVTVTPDKAGDLRLTRHSPQGISSSGEDKSWQTLRAPNSASTPLRKTLANPCPSQQPGCLHLPWLPHHCRGKGRDSTLCRCVQTEPGALLVLKLRVQSGSFPGLTHRKADRDG